MVFIYIFSVFLFSSVSFRRVDLKVFDFYNQRVTNHLPAEEQALLNFVSRREIPARLTVRRTLVRALFDLIRG